MTLLLVGNLGFAWGESAPAGGDGVYRLDFNFDFAIGLLLALSVMM